jgi:MoaA/NifB/PqqE/SkfB family radical SAM enzyme
MCGVYGDPAAGKNTLDLYQQFRNINPNITLGMNTNGALQSTFYWHELGRLFNQPRDYVVFSIDGLEDTNPVYRVNSNWSKLIANVEAFISAGGSAHWDMLVYQHNQHQVDACKQLANDMGFKWFRAKVSKRPLNNKLEFPIGWQIPNVDQGAIKCIAETEKSAYIDAQGQLYPCCWMPSEESQFKEIKLTWKSEKPNLVCQSTCAGNRTGNSFTNQWQQEIEL